MDSLSVGQHAGDKSCISGTEELSASQLSLQFTRVLRQNVTPLCVVELHLTFLGNFKALCRCAICLHLGHFSTPFVLEMNSRKTEALACARCVAVNNLQARADEPPTSTRQGSALPLSYAPSINTGRPGAENYQRVLITSTRKCSLFHIEYE